MILNHVWWFESSRQVMFFLLCNFSMFSQFFICASCVVSCFLCFRLGFMRFIVCKWVLLNHQKWASCFRVTTRLNLFNIEFWFRFVCVMHVIQLIINAGLFCFVCVVTCWFLQEFFLGCKYCLFASWFQEVGLTKMVIFQNKLVIIFKHSMGSWTLVGLRYFGVWKRNK